MERTLRWSRLAPRNEWLHLAFITGENMSGMPHDHDFAELFLFCGDRTVHHINGVDREIGGGTVALLRPSDRHCFAREAAGDRRRISLINLAFPADVMTEMRLRLWGGHDGFREDGEGTFPLHLTPGPRRIELLTDQFRELAAAGRGRLELERFLLNCFHLCRPAMPPGSPVMPDWLRRACRAMLEPEHLRGGIGCFQQLCGRCPEHCGRELKKHTGQTVTQYVNRLRLQYAARQLATTAAAIDEIAAEAGFEDLSYFYVMFRREYRQTPRRYRLAHCAQVV